MNLDKLGQLAVKAGDMLLAKEAFGRAYEMSAGACGVDSPLTKKLQVMVLALL